MPAVSIPPPPSDIITINSAGQLDLGWNYRRYGQGIIGPLKFM